MGDITFKADTSELKKFAVFWKQFAPKQARWASSFVLNDLAFLSRDNAIDEISQNMVVRDKGFVKSSVRVDKSNGRAPIEQQVSMMGSIAKPRATGWVEHQTGEKRQAKAVHGIGARGNKKRKVRKKYRLGQDMPGPDDYRFNKGMAGKPGWMRVMVMLRMLKRDNWIDKPFIVRGSDNIKKGIYRMTPSGKLRFVATLGKVEQPARFPWIENAVQKTLRKNNAKSLWRKHFINQMKRKHRMR